MLATVIAFAPTRAEAAGRLALALERTHLGGVATNRDFLVAALRTREFLAGDTTTDFIDRVRPARSLALGGDELARVARAAALWIQGANRAEASVYPRAAARPALTVALRRQQSRCVPAPRDSFRSGTAPRACLPAVASGSTAPAWRVTPGGS
jgi:acetyl/propionyl-CoA carboxylase alpha subunit